MTNQNFAYWLQGFTELNDDAMPTLAQWEMIKEHLKLANKIENFKPLTVYSYPPLPINFGDPLVKFDCSSLPYKSYNDNEKINLSMINHTC